MGFDIGALAQQMVIAAFAVVKDKSPGVGNYVKGECAKLAQTLATIEEENATGQITPQQAAILLDMQRTATRSVLTAAEGIGMLDAEAAINAALGAVKQAANAALGFALL